jgi:hypothetical protein
LSGACCFQILNLTRRRVNVALSARDVVSFFAVVAAFALLLGVISRQAREISVTRRMLLAALAAQRVVDKRDMAEVYGA